MNKSGFLLNTSLNYLKRNISTTVVVNGKKNFRKFLALNKRGTRIFKEQQKTAPHPKIPIETRGVRPTGVVVDGIYQEIPEKVPELIVADLKDCDLKPYVSYKTPDVYQPAFSSVDLFNAVYAKKIIDDYEQGKLDAEGNPMEPSEAEKLKSHEAWMRARKTGSDLF